MHIKFKIDYIDPKGRFVNLFGDFSPLCSGLCAQCNAVKKEFVCNSLFSIPLVEAIDD